MSKLKISENLFLEVNELTRIIKFLRDDGYKLAIKSIVKSFGIVENEGNTGFKVTQKSGSSDTVVINSGIAFDSNMNAIVMDSNMEMQVSNTGENRWLILSYDVKNTEIGTVSVNVDGTLTGIGTKFTEVLRGQPNFPTKVKFDSSINSGEYEVVKIISDTSAILSGSFTNASSMKYSVVGTFTPGFQPNDDNKLIYEYDSYNISLADSADKPIVNENQYIIARISYSASGSIVISDERAYAMFNNPYTQNSIANSNNNPLASLLSVAIVGGIKSDKTISADIELILEHGYKVLRYELITTSTSNSFNILSGSSNYLGNGNIPDGLFNGWLLVNRANMKYALINNNVNKSLLIPIFDSTIISEDVNEFIIVPNFLEMEFEVKVSNNVNKSDVPFYFKCSIWNLFSRLRIYSYFPSYSEDFSDEIEIEIGYRMINNEGKQNPFRGLAIAQFQNIDGQSETLSGSTFTVNIGNIEPLITQRNYS